MEDQDPIDRMLAEIEADLSPAELASAEYFANLAFDERLQNLLEAEPSRTHIALSSHTRWFSESPFFPPTGYVPTGMGAEEFTSELLEPIYEYSLTGELRVDQSITSLDMTIRDTDSRGTTQIKKFHEQPDTFSIERSNTLGIPTSWTLQDTRQVFHTLAKLFEIDVTEVTKAMRTVEESLSKNLPEARRAINKMHEQLVIQLWNEAGERGVWKKSRQISLDTPLQDPVFDTQSLRLEYAESEHPRDSLIQITLERSHISSQLDIEDVYSLRLVLDQSGDSSNRQDKHMIVDGTDAHKIRGFSFSHSHQGKTTPLDATDPEVQEMFIDWFDQLVAG